MPRQRHHRFVNHLALVRSRQMDAGGKARENQQERVSLIAKRGTNSFRLT